MGGGTAPTSATIPVFLISLIGLKAKCNEIKNMPKRKTHGTYQYACGVKCNFG